MLPIRTKNIFSGHLVYQVQKNVNMEKIDEVSACECD